jgi:hypothetical protein
MQQALAQTLPEGILWPKITETHDRWLCLRGRQIVPFATCHALRACKLPCAQLTDVPTLDNWRCSPIRQVAYLQPRGSGGCLVGDSPEMVLFNERRKTAALSLRDLQAFTWMQRLMQAAVVVYRGTRFRAAVTAKQAVVKCTSGVWP